MKKNKSYSKKNNLCVKESFKIGIHESLEAFRNQNVKTELEFPSSFTSTERAYAHELASQLGLKSKSKGKGASRYLTVSKKNQKENNDSAYMFEFGHNSSRVLHSLLTRYPVRQKERFELLPRSEKPKSGNTLEFSACKVDGSKTSGRLNTGIPQVPEPRKPGEFDSFRKTLPVVKKKDEIIACIQQNPVSLICGETGSGKTTQIPQFILDDCQAKGQACRILCTQPRRISAVSMAERVAAERSEHVGNTVGYQIRLESRVCPRTLLTFCTNGVLLRTLMTGDSALNTVTHIIIDEVHERDQFSDFLMIKIRQLLTSKHRITSPRHQKFKLILMSATLDFDLFVQYFNNCSVINVPGKMHDVTEYYLEDVLKLTKFNEGEVEKMIPLQQYKTKEYKDAFSATWNGNESSSNNTDGISAWAIDSMNKSLNSAWNNETGDVLSAFAQMFELIYNEGISVDYRQPESGVTPLMAAAKHGLYEECEQLLTLGAQADLKMQNDWTAADVAEKMEYIELAEVLLEFINNDWDDVSRRTETPDTTDAENELLMMYHQSFNDEEVDRNLILKLINIIHTKPLDGAILVFLPGYEDIVNLREMITSDPHLSNVKVFVLHSSIQSSADQRLVFKQPPSGCRKIVLSTNIAESSVTIDDIVYVIDSGKVKLKSYDAIQSMSTLKSVWIARSNADQRKGRAGRCRSGECFHLFSKARYQVMPQFQVAEILRMPLHELCLQAKLLTLGGKKRRSRDNESDKPTMSIEEFITNAPEAPSPQLINNAINVLKQIDALDNSEDLTELGQHLVDLPIEPKLGKMVLYSVVLKCLDPVLTIACVLAYKDPFVIPMSPEDKREAAECKAKFAAGTFSDHMCLLRAFQAWQKARSDGWEKAFCSQNYLSPATMEMIIGIRTQLLGQLRAAGFVRARGGSDIRDLNTNSENWAVVKAALCASAFPHILNFDRDKIKLSSSDHKNVRFHRSSTLAKNSNGKDKKVLSQLRSSWLIYDEMVQGTHSNSNRSFATARCCTAITPACLAVFAGPSYICESEAIKSPDLSIPVEGLTIDSDSEVEDRATGLLSTLKLTNWIQLKMDMQLASNLLQLRVKWHNLFLRRIRSPAKPWIPEDEFVLNSIINILSSEDQAHNLLQPSGIGQRPRPMSQEDNSNRSGSSISRRTYEQQYMNERSPSKYYQPDNRSNRHSNRNTPSATDTSNNNNNIQFDNETAYLCFIAKSAKNVLTGQLHGFWLLTPTEEEMVISAMKHAKNVVVIITQNDIIQGFAKLSSPVSPLNDNVMWQSYSWDASTKCTSFVTMDWQKVPHLPESPFPLLREIRMKNQGRQASSIFQLEEAFGKQLCVHLSNGWPIVRNNVTTQANHAAGDSPYKLNPYSPPYTALKNIPFVQPTMPQAPNHIQQ